MDEWKARAGNADNHWFDCLVGAAAAGSIQGAVLFGTEAREQARRPRVRLSDLRRRTR